MLKGRGTNVLYWKNGVVQGRLCWTPVGQNGKKKNANNLF